MLEAFFLVQNIIETTCTRIFNYQNKQCLDPKYTFVLLFLLQVCMQTKDGLYVAQFVYTFRICTNCGTLFHKLFYTVL